MYIHFVHYILEDLNHIYLNFIFHQDQITLLSLAENSKQTNYHCQISLCTTSLLCVMLLKHSIINHFIYLIWENAIIRNVFW